MPSPPPSLPPRPLPIESDHAGPSTQAARPMVGFDWQDWLEHLSGIDASEAEKRHYIEAVWAIILTFVDLGWEVGASMDASQIPENCGQVPDLADALRAVMVHSQDTSSDQNIPTQEEEV